MHTTEIHRVILEFIWKRKRPRGVETILEIKKQNKNKNRTENLHCVISDLLQSHSY